MRGHERAFEEVVGSRSCVPAHVHRKNGAVVAGSNLHQEEYTRFKLFPLNVSTLRNSARKLPSPSNKIARRVPTCSRLYKRSLFS